MESVWTLASLGMLSAIAMALRWSIARARPDDRGVVSDRWLSEQRHSESHDERR